MFQPGESLTFNNAQVVLANGLQAIAGGQTVIDFSNVVTVDSSAVAAMLVWRRAATARAASLAFNNLPANLSSLISLYDVKTLLDASLPRADLPHH